MQNGYLCYKKKDGTTIGKLHLLLPKTLIDRIHEDAEKKGFKTRNKWFVDHLLKHFGMVGGEGLSVALADRFMAQGQKVKTSR